MNFKYIIGAACASLLVVLAIPTGVAFGAPIIIVDQENPGPFDTTNGSSAPFSFGQSFTPTLPAIDAIEFLLGGSGTVVVRIRDGLVGADGLDGNIIAESLPVSVNILGSAVYHFDFLNRVSLIPGQEYVSELFIQTGWLGVRHTQGNAYAGGQFLHQDFSPTTFTDLDLVFTEGLHAPIPVPAAIYLFGSGLIGLIGIARRRKS